MHCPSTKQASVIFLRQQARQINVLQALTGSRKKKALFGKRFPLIMLLRNSDAYRRIKAMRYFFIKNKNRSFKLNYSFFEEEKITNLSKPLRRK